MFHDPYQRIGMTLSAIFWLLAVLSVLGAWKAAELAWRFFS